MFDGLVGFRRVGKGNMDHAVPGLDDGGVRGMGIIIRGPVVILDVAAPFPRGALIVGDVSG